MLVIRLTYCLCPTLTRCGYSPRLNSQAAENSPDQAQAMAFSLTRVTTQACNYNPDVAQLVLKEAAIGMLM